jgi:hypothetical protein
MDCFAALAMTEERVKLHTPVIPRGGGRSSTPRPIVLVIGVSGILDHPLSRVMTIECASTFSRRDAPGVLQENLTLSNRGRREDRVRAAPAVSCAIAQNKVHMSIQVSGEHTGLPCAMALRLTSCSPRRTGFVVTVAFGWSRKLDASVAASGPHDFTVRNNSARLTPPSRPPLPAPRLRRWPTPLWWDRMAGVVHLICPTRPAIYF